MAPSRGRDSRKQKDGSARKATPGDKNSTEVTGRPDAEDHSETHSNLQPIQQSILSAFQSIVPLIIHPDEDIDEKLPRLLQAVKGHLYSRDFDQAFGRQEYLQAYAVRWSASRALGYLSIFAEVFQHVGRAHDDSHESKTVQVTCLGGGSGSELVALAALKRYFQAIDNASPSHFNNRSLTVTAVDMADWSSVLQTLYHAATNPPPISAYASAAAKASNVSMAAPSTFHYAFEQADLLHPDAPSPRISSSINQSALITLMFTLNELYTSSFSRTQTLLLHLTASTEPGALLLVVDSPGSYSTVALGSGAGPSDEGTPHPAAPKQYPMKWLLEHTLLTQAPKVVGGDSAKACWEVVSSCDSRWFRFPPREDRRRGGLRYPIDLEDMRVQMHLYRRI